MKKPNVIIIMTDDQGYGDLSCMGATDFRTPNIDAVAEDGIRFSSMYSASPNPAGTRYDVMCHFPFRLLRNFSLCPKVQV